MSRVKMLARKKLYDFAQEKGAMPKMAEGGMCGYDDGGPVDPNSKMGKAFSSIRGAFGNPDKKDDDQQKQPQPTTSGYDTTHPAYAMGGEVEGDTEDEMWGSYHPHDSSGEPHTDDDFEEEQPMEYMAHGGVIRGSEQNFIDRTATDQMNPDLKMDEMAGIERDDMMNGMSRNEDYHSSKYYIPDTEDMEDMPHLAVGGKLGNGDRFEHLTHQLAGKGADDPKALAAYIGRKSLGKERFQKLAAKGKKMSSGGMAFANALKRHGMK